MSVAAVRHQGPTAALHPARACPERAPHPAQPCCLGHLLSLCTPCPLQPMPGGKVVKLTGIKSMGRTATVLLRGSNKMMLDEAERSLHDALCVVRSLCQKQFMIPGGAAPEVELTLRLSEWARTLVGMDSYCIRAFAEAMEVRASCGHAFSALLPI